MFLDHRSSQKLFRFIQRSTFPSFKHRLHEVHRRRLSLYPKSEEKTLITTMVTSAPQSQSFIPMRTVRILQKNGSREVEINAHLDDASNRIYLNSDVAAELGLVGESTELMVSLLNDNNENLKSSVVGVEVVSLDGRVWPRVSAYTTKRATGNLSAWWIGRSRNPSGSILRTLSSPL